MRSKLNTTLVLAALGLFTIATACGDDNGTTRPERATRVESSSGSGGDGATSAGGSAASGNRGTSNGGDPAVNGGNGGDVEFRVLQGPRRKLRRALQEIPARSQRALRAPVACQYQASIVCVECGGPAFLVGGPSSALPRATLLIYRCRDCGDRFDLVVEPADMNDGDDLTT